MKLETKVVCACTLILSGLAYLEMGQAKSPPTGHRPADGLAPAALTEGERAVTAHWSQFGEGYIAPLTVTEQIESLGPINLILLDRHLDREHYTIGWNETGLMLSFNGEPVKLTTDEDGGGHLNWQTVVTVPIRNGRVVKETLEARDGFIVATSDSLVFQIEAAENVYRIEVPLILNHTASDLALAIGAGGGSCASCNCKALPPKGACAPADCDKSNGCAGKNGPGTGTCVWGTPVSCE